MHRSTLAFVFVVAACGDNFEGNTPPTITDLVLTTDEDTPLTRTLDVSDREGDPVTITLDDAAHGTVTMGAGGSFTYTPDPNYAGPDTFGVRASDGRVESRATVSITVTAINDAPTGIADAFATSEDTPHAAATSALLGNDTDVDGDTLSITGVGDAVNGTVAIVGGDVVFTPSPDFIGSGTYRYALSDGTATADVTVTITVGGVNDPPVATDDTATTAEDTDLVIAGTTLVANDTDPEGQTLAVMAVTAGTGGTVTLAGGDVTFTPAANFNGAASFTYTVTDGQDTDTATVDVTVTAVNDAPVAGADAATTAEDTAVTVLATTMLANDTDVEGQTLTITAAGNATNGTIAFTAGDVTFTPTTNVTGTGSFEYTVSDGTATATGTVTVTITAVNDHPVAVDDMATTSEDVPAVITGATLVANDVDIDGDALQVTSVSNASTGTVSLAAGTVTFTPPPNFSGTATFDYTVSDGTLSDTGTVTVVISAVNDPPIAVDDAASTAEDTVLVVAGSTLLANDTDAEGQGLTVTAVANATNGTVTLASGDATFTPDANFSGTATFEYTVSDGNGGTDTGLVTITVTAVNDAPVAGPDAAQVELGVATDFATSTFLANDTDVDGGALAITAVANASNGATVALNGTTITYTGTNAGVASFEYTVSDGNGGTATGLVTVNVIANVCGDGFLGGGEQCDDNDTDPGDGCSATCTIEAGWLCTGQPSTCTTTCGDGIPVGTEQCDDGDQTNGNGCDNNCTPTGCNNGIVTAGEQCDDGDADDTDGCTTQCVIGVVCSATDVPNADRFATDPATGTCYASFDAEQTTFADAQAACVTAGGHLATITSAAENARVVSVQNPTENPWIGASEDGNDTDGVFDWVTTEAFGFSAFAAGQPDDDVGVDGNGDCLHLLATTGEWNDTNCNITTFVVGRICELAVDTCGDGVLQTVNNELCDDGNQVDGDGCSSTCTLETFVRFSFTGAAGSEATFAADATPTTLAATPTMSRGTGLTASPAANTFSANNFTLSATLDANDYYAFTVTPNANVTMKLLALELDERRSSTGIRSWSIRSSIDNFATDLATFSVPDNDLTRTNQRVFLGPAFAALTTAVEFRIYGFAAEAAAGTWRIDNVELSGTAQ